MVCMCMASGFPGDMKTHYCHLMLIDVHIVWDLVDEIFEVSQRVITSNLEGLNCIGSLYNAGS